MTVLYDIGTLAFPLILYKTVESRCPYLMVEFRFLSFPSAVSVS